MTLPFSLSAALRRRAVGAAALALVLGLGACATTGPMSATMSNSSAWAARIAASVRKCCASDLAVASPT